jgi:hypothetical protein
MNRMILALAASAVGLGSINAVPAVATAQDGPAVKMSKTGICHPRSGGHYSRTKNFTPYKSMDACIKAGGRPSKT